MDTQERCAVTYVLSARLRDDKIQSQFERFLLGSIEAAAACGFMLDNEIEVALTRIEQNNERTLLLPYSDGRKSPGIGQKLEPVPGFDAPDPMPDRR